MSVMEKTGPQKCGHGGTLLYLNECDVRKTGPQKCGHGSRLLSE